MKVREVIKRIEAEGWVEVAQRGSHRQFKHPAKRGRITVAGKPSADMDVGTARNIFRQAGMDWSER